MSAASVVSHLDFSRRKKKITATVALSNNYATGGQVVDLTALTNPKLLVNAFPGSVPSEVRVVNCPAGYTAEWVPGTTLANGKLKCYSAAGTEVSAGAYPAALAAAPVTLELSGPMGRF